VRYFIIKDLVDQGDVEIHYCPTKEMWSDILTKPKQGQGFLLMRLKLLECGINGEMSGGREDNEHAQRSSSGLHISPCLPEGDDSMSCVANSVTHMSHMESLQRCVGGSTCRYTAQKGLHMEVEGACGWMRRYVGGSHSHLAR
jgi:hypothetical protein